MVDYNRENAIARLRAAYVENRRLSDTMRAEVKAKYREIIENEIAEKKRGNDVAFAQLLAREKEEHGLPVTLILDEVFRSRTWSRWQKWQELAGLDPERVRAERARAEATVEKIRVGDDYTWSEDWDVLTWTAHPVTGADVTVEIPVGAGAFEMYAAQGTQAAVYALAGMYDRDEFAQFHPLGDYAAMEGELRGVHSKEYVAWVTALSEAIKAAVEAGKIPEIAKEDV